MRLCRPTESESLLWESIRAKRLGVVFRRQVVIAGKYIADFVAPSVKVIVEVDGGYHALRPTADAHRDRDLERLGYTIVRVDAKQVLSALPLAVGRVREALKVRRKY
jgi:very-short-patch-repair endonuclease